MTGIFVYDLASIHSCQWEYYRWGHCADLHLTGALDLYSTYPMHTHLNITLKSSSKTHNDGQTKFAAYHHRRFQIVYSNYGTLAPPPRVLQLKGVSSVIAYLASHNREQHPKYRKNRKTMNSIARLHIELTKKWLITLLCARSSCHASLISRPFQCMEKAPGTYRLCICFYPESWYIVYRYSCRIFSLRLCSSESLTLLTFNCQEWPPRADKVSRRGARMFY